MESIGMFLAAGCVALALRSGSGAAEPSAFTAKLNGLEIVLDGRTGAIIRLGHPGPGTFLEADEGDAGLIDGAYPIERFEPLRLAARHSDGAIIERSEGAITIRIPRLGPSRSHFSLEGDVAAIVTLRAAPDGRSVILSAEIENRSPRPVRQVVFPELRGLVAVAGPDRTILKSCGFGSAPFRELLLPEADQWYASNSSTVEHKPGGMFSTMWGRWLDLGGLKGGFSLFPLRWGWDPATTTFVQLRQATGKLRLLWVHAAEVRPGEKWSSGEWVLTPHRAGWAKGIEPYREFVRSRIERKYPLPKHVREGLGFRTLWMCQNHMHD